MVDEQGGSWDCSRVVHVSGGGLRVELSWVGQHDNDEVDLHLHRDVDSRWFNRDDCHFNNCETWGSSLDWGYADTPAGPNSRLDIDDTHGLGPENINLDAPAPNDWFRVMVHYYDGGGRGGDRGQGHADAIVRIYCGGALVAQYGPATIESEGDGVGELWRVADVTMDAAGTGCEATLLHRGDGGGFDIRRNASRDRL